MVKEFLIKTPQYVFSKSFPLPNSGCSSCPHIRLDLFTGSISITKYLADKDLTDQHSHLSFRSDESFVL